jgi:large subunit ribosomal protein L25
MVTLEYTIRTAGKKSEQMGMLPGVFYGKKQASTPVHVSLIDFIKVWKQAGESSVVTLAGSTPVDVLIQDVTIDPVSSIPQHVDFYVFEKGKKIEVSVPLVFTGVSPAVKDLGANLVKVLHEITVEASPENLPHDITVDISTLIDLDSVIIASDLKLPAGVSLAVDAEEVVASVSAAKAEEIEEPTTAPDLSAIEVVKKGKKDEEEPTPAQ